MKKIIYLFVISLAVVSCSSDDDSDNNKLATPSLISPSNNSTVVAEEFYNEFVWSNIENADQYLIQLSSTSDFSNIIDDATSVVHEDDPYHNTRTYFYLGDLVDGGTYYWRVRAFGAGYEASDYSSSFSFKVNIL